MLRVGSFVEIGVFDVKAARIGDIVLFVERSRLTIHRIVGVSTGGSIRTCSDARPWAQEIVLLENVVGKIVGAYTKRSGTVVRIDDVAFYRAGILKARLRGVVAFMHDVKSASSRGLPWRRQAPFAAVLDIISGELAGRADIVCDAIDRVDPDQLLAYVARHVCWQDLQSALERVHSRRSRDLTSAMQVETRSGAISSFAYRIQLDAVVASLKDAGIPFALLKGAAHAYAGDSRANVHVSKDIDIIVPASAIDAAVGVLTAAGYSDGVSKRTRRWYYNHSHHIAPLFPTNGGWPIELHLQLERSKWISTQTTWGALAQFMTIVSGTRGPVTVLDAVGTALHHAIHGIGFGRLRDVAICARALLTLDAGQLDVLERIVARERRDQIRLRTFFAIASQCAGIRRFELDKRERAYVRWVNVRESLPFRLAKRMQSFEAWYAGGSSVAGLRFRYLAAGGGNVPRILGRLAIVPFALLYLSFVRR